MQISTAFQELGISAVLGTELLDTLGLSTDDIQIPQRFSKFQSVIHFLKQFPEDTQRFLINKATRGKTVDKLEHFYDYTNLLREKAEYEKVLDRLEKDFSVIEMSDDLLHITEVQVKLSDTKQKLGILKEEQEIYES